MDEAKKAEIKQKYFNSKSIKFKIVFSISLTGLLLLAMILVLLSSSLTKVEEKLMNDKFLSDIAYIEDQLDSKSDGEGWRLENDTLYYGDLLIGDGSSINPELERDFEHFSEISKTLNYVFIKVNDKNLDNDGDNEVDLVYDNEQNCYLGHYRRVCGSWHEEDDTLVGTYLNKQICDDMETNFANTGEGIYTGNSTVYGEKMYCRYQLILDNNNEIVGAICVGKKNADMLSYINQQRGKSIILYICFMALGTLAIAFLCTKIVGHLKEITIRLDEIGDGKLNEPPLKIETNDELQEIAEKINEMQISLQEKQRIGSELGIAKNIQASMLPRIFPAFPSRREFDIFAIMTPAKEVGGDFYDFFFCGENKLAIVMADVSGKGVPAALVMAITKALIKNQSQLNSEPKDILRNVNNTICEGNEMNLFITTWLGILDIETGILKFTNAGHNPPLIKRGETFEYLTPRHGFVLGGMSGVNYKQDQIQLNKGDRIFLYTDGVTEATSVDKELYGEERLKNYLNTHQEFNPKQMVGYVYGELFKFMSGTEQFDDITMLMLDYFGPQDIPDGVELELDATLENLDKVNDFIEEQCSSIGVDRKTIMQILVCVEEIYVNIAHYAYGDKTGKAYIIFAKGDGYVEIIFKDKGVKFDPLAKKDPDITLSAEERDIGGLGILMVKKTMDDVKYKYQDNYNILSIMKKVGTK